MEAASNALLEAFRCFEERSKNEFLLSGCGQQFPLNTMAEIVAGQANDLMDQFLLDSTDWVTIWRHPVVFMAFANRTKANLETLKDLKSRKDLSPELTVTKLFLERTQDIIAHMFATASYLHAIAWKSSDDEIANAFDVFKQTAKKFKEAAEQNAKTNVVEDAVVEDAVIEDAVVDVPVAKTPIVGIVWWGTITVVVIGVVVATIAKISRLV